MRIAISGHSGLLGSSIKKELLGSGHEVILLARSDLYNFKLKTLRLKLAGCQAVIQLAGAPILQRWNKKNRKEISDSRVVTTRNIVAGINALPAAERPELFISASAIGIYREGIVHSEKSEQFAGNFAAQVIRDWETASENLPKNIRRVIFRIGLVLDKNALLVKKLKLPFLLGVGGPIGNGSQPFPFIHIDDVSGAVNWALTNENAHGIYNLVAPEQVSNKEFSKQFAASLQRPSWLPVPKLPLRLIYGQAAQIIYESPGAIPERLIAENYPFRFTELHLALEDIMKKRYKKAT